LAYEKKAFLEVEGYQHIDQKASGDDMLLVYKIAHKFSNNIQFLKNKYAIVFTEPQRTLTDFLQQRFRWTSKSRSYQDRRITVILGLVYLFVLSIWMNLFYFILRAGYSILFPEKTLIALINFLPALLFLFMSVFQVICKTLVDYFFLRSSVAFFNRSDLMRSFFISELYHIWYIPFVGTFGNIFKYKWKGRELN
jgi:cellulose synthase/poly-beta-1,6-N-acetylglucosamine synthase-like glycosyltransferase